VFGCCDLYTCHDRQILECPVSHQLRIRRGQPCDRGLLPSAAWLLPSMPNTCCGGRTCLRPRSPGDLHAKLLLTSFDPAQTLVDLRVYLVAGL